MAMDDPRIPYAQPAGTAGDGWYGAPARATAPTAPTAPYRAAAPAFPTTVNEDWWRANTGHAANKPGSYGASFDPNSVYDPKLADYDKMIAQVKAGNANWDINKLQNERQQYMNSDPYQKEVANARNQFNTQQTDWLSGQFQGKANAVADSLRNINADNPNVKQDSDRYYAEADAPIQQQYYQAGDQEAAYLSRMGMGESAGINTAASAQLTQNKGALESQARMKATDMAMDKERQRQLDQFSVEAMGMQPELQKYGIDTSKALAQMQLDAQMKMFQEQMDAQSAAGKGSLYSTSMLAGPMGPLTVGALDLSGVI